jgi:hypothetical protein
MLKFYKSSLYIPVSYFVHAMTCLDVQCSIVCCIIADVVSFDNNFSWKRHKEVFFSTKVLPPSVEPTVSLAAGISPDPDPEDESKFKRLQGEEGNKDKSLEVCGGGVLEEGQEGGIKSPDGGNSSAA